MKLAQYAKEHGSTEEIFKNAGWADKGDYLEFPTPGGIRRRWFTGSSKYTGSSSQCWYRLAEAINLITDNPLIIANGEASTVAAQGRGLPVTCVTMGEKSKIPDNLVTELRSAYPHKPIFIVFDSDSTGIANAPKLAKQLTDAGYNVCYIVWPNDLPEHYDLSDWLRDNPYDDFYVYFDKHAKFYFEVEPENEHIANLTADGTSASDWHVYFQQVLEKLPYERIGAELFEADIVIQRNGEMRFDNADLGNLDIDTERGVWHSWRDAHIKGRGPVALVQLAIYRGKYEQCDKEQKQIAIEKIQQLTGIAPPQPKALEPGQVMQINKSLSTKEIAVIITQLGYICRYNDMNDDIEINGEIQSDRILKRVFADMFDVGVKNKSDVELGLSRLAEANRYHPIKEYLNKLTWNGENTIRMVADCLESDCPETTYNFLRRWLIGAVAKSLDQKQNVMLVLSGGQGIGKSTFTKWLTDGIGNDYYLDQKLNLEDKDIQVRAMSVWIWEVGELGATTRKVDYEALKQFITQQTIRVRKSHDKKDTIKPVTASYVGTVNDDGAGFLIDPTGNRRFIVLPLNRINRSYGQIDIDQLWAQAVYLYKSGEPHELTSEEKEIQQEINKRFESVDPLEDAIRGKYEIGGTESILASEILAYAKTVGNFGNDKQIQKDLSKVLTKMGAKKGQNAKGLTVYRGVREAGKQKLSGFGSGYRG